MNTAKEKLIWTIGHSTHTLEVFLQMLEHFRIKHLVDIRNYPGSRRYPHFNKESLENSLPLNGIEYLHLKDLGGRRTPVKDSINTGWKNTSFRGYADYMQTEEFKNAVHLIQRLAEKNRTAYMCSEAVWWRCHRSLVSDYLKINGWTVMHITSVDKEQEHRYTSPAKIVDGRLSYKEDGLF